MVETLNTMSAILQTGIAQSVQRLANRCTVWCSKLVKARISAPVQTGPETHPNSCTLGTGILLGVKRPKRGVDHQPASGVKFKERVELCIFPPPCLHGLLLGEYRFLRQLHSVHRGYFGEDSGQCVAVRMILNFRSKAVLIFHPLCYIFVYRQTIYRVFDDFRA